MKHRENVPSSLSGQPGMHLDWPTAAEHRHDQPFCPNCTPTTYAYEAAKHRSDR